MKSFWITLLCAAAALFFPVPSSAGLIVLTHTGTGSIDGSLGGGNFSTTSFTITATGNTAQRDTFDDGYFIDHASASITIDGQGTFDFTTPTRTFVNNTLGIVGFARAGAIGDDLYDGPTNSVFSTWDMMSSIGPIVGDTELTQWHGGSYGDIVTSGGVLVFDDATITGTFEAVVTPTAVPEPGTPITFGSALGVLLARRARRRRR
jgi:hypothetical protein